MASNGWRISSHTAAAKQASRKNTRHGESYVNIARRRYYNGMAYQPVTRHHQSVIVNAMSSLRSNYGHFRDYNNINSTYGYHIAYAV